MTWDLIKAILGLKKPEPKPVWDDPAAIELKVREIVAEYQKRDINEVTLETNVFEEEASVGNLEVIMLCEEAFDIEIPEDYAEQMETVDAIVKYIRAKLGV